MTESYINDIRRYWHDVNQQAVAAIMKPATGSRVTDTVVLHESPQLTELFTHSVTV